MHTVKNKKGADMLRPRYVDFQPWMMVTNAIIMTGVWITLILSIMNIL